MSQPPAEPLTIPAELPLSEAREIRDRLLAALAAAGEAGQPLALDFDGAAPRPPALQLLAATEKSALRAGVALELGPTAAQVRLPFSDSQ